MPEDDPPSAIRYAARAKINLGLEVIRKRPDGYHEIRSLMQSIGLADELEFARAATRRLSLRCPDSSLPLDERNLVLRAARLLQERMSVRQGARIVLRKRIPLGAGLGGGSSDAAATLVALSRLWGLRLGRVALEELGAEIGSDVPFFIRGGTQLATGRGELLKPIPHLPRVAVGIVFPSLFVPTASIYADPKITLTPLGPLTRLHLCDLATRSETVTCAAQLRNDLENVVLRRFPVVAELSQELRDPRVGVVRVSGSGSSLFLLCEEPKVLREVLGRAGARGHQVYTTWFCRRGWVSVGP